MNDKLFLLSTEEYEKYEDVIPHINTTWWLRSPGITSNYATHVNYDGYAYSSGCIVNYNGFAVRPALKIKNPKSLDLKVGDRITAYNFPFIVIDVEEGLAIAEVPIAFRRFDKSSHDYEKSEIRQFLAEWVVEREEYT